MQRFESGKKAKKALFSREISAWGALLSSGAAPGRQRETRWQPVWEEPQDIVFDAAERVKREVNGKAVQNAGESA